MVIQNYYATKNLYMGMMGSARNTAKGIDMYVP